MPDPMNAEELEAFRENAPERAGGELWSLLDWTLWAAGMADVFREPLADTMLAAVPDQVRAHAEAIMADFKKRREITKTGVTVYQEQRNEVERLAARLQAAEAAMRTALNLPTRLESDHVLRLFLEASGAAQAEQERQS